jgi:DNA polymerase
VPWNFSAQPDDCIYLDFETQSAVDIRKQGGRAYVMHKSTRIALTIFARGDQKTVWVTPGVVPPGYILPDGWDLHAGSQPPEWVLDGINSGLTLCAHNAAGFDQPVWDRLVKVPALWTDSAYFCRCAGLPGGLDKVGKALFDEGKREYGYALINILCKAKPSTTGGYVYPASTANSWSLFIEYACQDVNLLQKLFPIVRPYGDTEVDVMRVHQIINERGFPVDGAFAARLVLLQHEIVSKCGEKFEDLSGIDAADARSVKKVTEWLTSIGVSLPLKNGKPTLDRKELTRLFKEPDAFTDGPNEEMSSAIEALKLRMEMTRSSAGKALAIVRAVNDNGRVTQQLVYGGAHTLRFSGKDTQPQNFPRGVKGVTLDLCRSDLTLEEIESLVVRINEDAAKKPGFQQSSLTTASDVVSTLLRPVIASPAGLAKADYASIEARGLAWVCQEPAALQEFWKWEADPYIPLASQIFGRPITKHDELERWVGKQAVLGSGYGMSWRKFILYCAVQGVDLHKVGVDPQQVVKLYRQNHPNIVAGWRALHDGTLEAVKGKTISACRCTIYMEDGNLHIMLPSGRPIVYRNARIEMMVPAYAKLFGTPANPVETVCFDHPHGYRGFLYGGRIMENVVQAICRDLLVAALIRVEDAGLNIVLHVHDEIVTEGTDMKELARLMSIQPDWARDFPIMVEADKYTRYAKSLPKGVESCKALNGEVK